MNKKYKQNAGSLLLGVSLAVLCVLLWNLNGVVLGEVFTKLDFKVPTFCSWICGSLMILHLPLFWVYNQFGIKASNKRSLRHTLGNREFWRQCSIQSALFWGSNQMWNMSFTDANCPVYLIYAMMQITPVFAAIIDAIYLRKCLTPMDSIGLFLLVSGVFSFVIIDRMLVVENGSSDGSKLFDSSQLIQTGLIWALASVLCFALKNHFQETRLKEAPGQLVLGGVGVLFFMFAWIPALVLHLTGVEPIASRGFTEVTPIFLLLSVGVSSVFAEYCLILSLRLTGAFVFVSTCALSVSTQMAMIWTVQTLGIVASDRPLLWSNWYIAANVLLVAGCICTYIRLLTNDETKAKAHSGEETGEQSIGQIAFAADSKKRVKHTIEMPVFGGSFSEGLSDDESF